MDFSISRLRSEHHKSKGKKKSKSSIDKEGQEDHPSANLYIHK
jgi:hypothetical protein